MTSPADAFFSQLDSVGEKFTTLTASLKTHRQGYTEAIAAFVKESEDETAVKLRAQIERCTEKLNELAKEKVGGPTLTDEQVSAMETEARELKKEWRDMYGAIETFAKYSSDDAVKDRLASLEDPTKSVRVGGTGGSEGSGSPRPSVTITVVSGNLAGEVWTTFSKAKAELKIVSVEDLQKLYADAVNLPLAEISSYDGEPVTIEAAGHTMTVAPRERKSRGPASKVASEKAPKDDKEIAASAVTS